MKYYDIEPIRSKGCDYNFIVSGRGPGKSTAVVNMLIDAMARGEQFVRIARYNWEVTRQIMSQWFNDVNMNHLHDVIGDDVSIDYKTGVFYLIGEDERRYTVGYVVSLNDQDVFKSASYDKVTNVVFEEFAQMSDRDYARGEIELFLSALSTIVRNRQNVKVWFIGNTLSKHNPYFDFFGVDVDRIGLVPGDIRTFRCAGFEGMGATVAIEYAHMSHSDISEISPLMRIGGNITATSGLYAVQPTVAEYKDRTARLLDDDYIDFLPGIAGAYFGGDLFARVRVTRKPRYDDMPLLALSSWDVGIEELHEHKFLNLSGVANPTYTVMDCTRRIPTVSPWPIVSDTKTIRRLREVDAKCVHAYELDEYRYKWRNFIDGYGYDKGVI